jgi:hypothetical protein
MTSYIEADNTAKRLAKAAYPSYRGRKIKVQPISPEHTIDVRSYWDGGSRDYFAFVNLATGEVSSQVPAQSAYDRQIGGADRVSLPRGIACVQHTIFCGKDLGLRLIVRADDLAPSLTEHSAA